MSTRLFSRASAVVCFMALCVLGPLMEWAPVTAEPRSSFDSLPANNLPGPISITGGPVQAPASSNTGTVLRAFAYHQITSFTARPSVNTNRRSAILSADGSRAAFVTGGEPARIHVINADGTGPIEIDAHPAGGYTSVDISADGSRVLSWYGEAGAGAGVARLVNADGSNPHTVFSAWEGYKFFRLSADGTRVYFAASGSFDFGGGRHSAGLYVINADGSGLRQIVDRAQVHALFGKPIPELEFYWGGTVPFALSDDDNRIVLQVYVQDLGFRIMRVNDDGSGLQAYSLFPPSYYSYVTNLGISGDGRVAFYEVSSDPWELGVFNWDGSGKRVLASGVGGANTGGEVVQLTYDGSKLSYGSLNRLYNTDGSGVLQLSAMGPTLSNDPPLMVGNWGLYRSSMNRDATRFLFTFDNNTWIGETRVPEQLGILEMNPPTLGQSPNLADPSIAPPYLVIGNGSTTTFSVRMSTANTHLRTNSVVFRNGLEVPSNIVNDAVLYDDGSNGDATAGDGRFTYGYVRANTGAAVGPHVVRMKTEVRGADGRRHATAIDVGQLDVVTAVPLPTPLDLTVSRLEVNQSIQNDVNSIPLISYKRTVVRAYVAIGNSAGPIAGVTGRLKGYRGPTLLGAVEPFNPRRSIIADKTPDWRQINHTLNFEVPFSWLTGDVRLEVEVNPGHSVVEGDYSNNAKSAIVRFVDGGDLRIAWLPIRYVAPGYAGPAAPGSRVAKGDAWLKATYPVSHTRVKYYPWPGITWGGNVNVGEGGIQLLKYLNRLLQLSQRQPWPDHVYGWLPGGVYGGNGLAWYPGKTAFGNDTDGRWRRTFAHEIGHNRNIGHWDATIRVHGFDVAAREVKEDTKLDFMVPGRLEREAWIAPEIYTYLHEHMVAALNLTTSPTGTAAVEYLLTSGLINQVGTASFDVFYRQAQTDPLENPPPGTDYCLELYDAGSTKLSGTCFDVSFGFGDGTTPMTTAPFALTVPFPTTTRQIVLKHGDAVVASRVVSNNAPTVSVSTPGGGAVKTVNWTASDMDGDTLSYSVLYSADNKQSWFAVATDLTGTTYSLDTNTLPGGAGAFVRVLATDGVNTGQADAGPFSVDGKGPMSVIDAPADQAAYAPGDNVFLIGDGFDLEDGSLPDASLAWSSDRNGALGTGRTLVRSDLSEGTHHITLVAMDSQGNQVTDSITLYIRQPSLGVYLPFIVR